jgi:hypothetical protein
LGLKQNTLQLEAKIFLKWVLEGHEVKYLGVEIDFHIPMLDNCDKFLLPQGKV